MVLRQTSCGMAALVAAEVGRALRASRIRGGGPQSPQIGGGNLPPPRFAGTEARHPEGGAHP